MLSGRRRSNLRELRLLWRATSDSTGYIHPSLVLEACRLLEPPPGSWMSKNLWLAFYNEDELPKNLNGADPFVVSVFRRGFDFYSKECNGNQDSNI